MTEPATVGAEILDDVAAFIGQYLAFPSPYCLPAVTLWAAHTHAPRGTFYVTPRLILDSAEPGSGKTRVLELLAQLVGEPELILSPTVAAIFRMLLEGPRTLLFDEVEPIFNPRNTNYEDLRALLNAGYKRGATIPRCVGDAAKMRVQRFPVFAPAALAGLAGRMPATITTRSVTIHMRKRAPGEHVAPYYEEDAEVEAQPLREQLHSWVSDAGDGLGAARPVMPRGVVDRPAEVWKALLAIADAAGGEWPERGREACRYFVLQSDPGELSIGVRLLSDLRELYTRHRTDRMPSAEIVTELCKLDEAPWSDLWGKQLDTRRLAKELDRYGVRPVQFKAGGEKQRGYVTWPTDKPVQGGLIDAWSRYLPETGTSGTAGTEQVNPVPDQPPVPDVTGTPHLTGTGLTSEVPLVPEVPQESGQIQHEAKTLRLLRTKLGAEPLDATGTEGDR